MGDRTALMSGTRHASFPFTSMFQSGRRREACAPEDLFKGRRDPPTLRKRRALLTAADRSEDLLERRRRGQGQSRSES